jgi:serine/threonine protein kinase
MLKDKNDEKVDLKHDHEDGHEPVNDSTEQCQSNSTGGSESQPLTDGHPATWSHDPHADKTVLPSVDSHTPSPLERLRAMTADLPSYYEVMDVLGEGGMGAVFKVRDARLDKLFAIKMLRPEFVHEELALSRFSREARAAKGLTHVNLAAVYDYGIGKHGAPYLVMDYLEGRSLEEIIKAENGLSVPRAVDLFLQMVEAVGYAHARGVVHRDLKPSNMIIERDEAGSELVKLVDFGIAKSLLATDTGRTRTGDVIGSPPYMSPEQCEGLRLDARSDIYSLGCVMYETLCGRPPFVGANSIQTILKHMREHPVPISDAAKQQMVSEDLSYIIMRCLEKDRSDRYETVAALQKDLRLFKAKKQIKRVVPQSERTSLNWPFFARMKRISPVTLTVWVSAITTCICAAVVGANIFSSQQAPEANTGPDHSPAPTETAPHIPSHLSVQDQIIEARHQILTHYLGNSNVKVQMEEDSQRMLELADTYANENKFLQAAPLYEFTARTWRSGKLSGVYEDAAISSYLQAGEKDLAAQRFQKLFQEIEKSDDLITPRSYISKWAKTYSQLLREQNQPEQASQIEKRWL